MSDESEQEENVEVYDGDRARMHETQYDRDNRRRDRKRVRTGKWY